MAGRPQMMRGPKTFDPNRASQILSTSALPPKPGGGGGSTISHSREEQLRALGFDDMGQSEGEDSEEEEEADHFYAPTALKSSPSGSRGGLERTSGSLGAASGSLAPSGPVPPSEKFLHLEEQLVTANAARTLLEKSVESLQRQLQEEQSNKAQSLRALKTAEDQIVYLKTSSQQQLAMLRRERELIAQSGTMVVAAGAGGGGGAANGVDAQEVAMLQKKNRQLEAELSALKQGQGAPAAPDGGPAEVARLKQLLTEQQAVLDEHLASAAAGGDMSAQLAAELEKVKAAKAEADAQVRAERERQKEMDLEAEERDQELVATLEELEKLKHASAASADEQSARYMEEIEGLKAGAQAARAEAAAALQSAVAPLQQQLQAAQAEAAEARETAAGWEEAAVLAEEKAESVEAGCQADRARLADMDNQFQQIYEKYKRECRARRKLHNQLQDLKGQIRVFCRVRPLSEKERASGDSESISYPDDDLLVIAGGGEKADKEFEFDRVYTPANTQSNVFEDTEPLVTSVLDGYNVCVFAYGQTGSGKTHTMEGPSSDPGVNSRALSELFRLTGERADTEEITIQASLLEIYNESIRDLLAKSQDTKLDVRQGSEGVYVPDLSIVGVSSIEEVERVIAAGKKNRTTFATNMNEHSSRSHSILSIYTQSKNLLTGVVLTGKLHLVDLAGSERVGKTDASGDRLKEAQAINKSLSSLGDVISALGSKQAHVPYRNSKLTYLLQDSLGGDSKTLMFVNINPAMENQQESMCSLNFASRVRMVELGQATKHASGTPSKSSTPKR